MPDFAGLPLDKYLTPKPVLPLRTTRGCYYGKCAFCSVSFGAAPCVSVLPAAQLADQMLELSRRHRLRHVYFVDEAIPPRILRELPPLLERQGAGLDWGGCVRFEPDIGREEREAMRRGGCRLHLLGLESGSARVLRAMHKNETPDGMAHVLADNRAAGIWNHVFCFFGFPGETAAEADETLRFVRAHGETINSIAFGPFALMRYSPAFMAPGEYGINGVGAEPERDLAVYFNYATREGMGREKAERLCADLQRRLPVREDQHLYCSDVFRLLHASWLNDRNMAFPSITLPGPAGPEEENSRR
jgi:hypothetical protein